ncbi:MAG: ABC transporter permease [bacterium]
MRKPSIVWTIFRREFRNYFNSPVAYVFLVAFLLLVNTLTFLFGQYYEGRQADLMVFFLWHPWVYLLLVPAATMGLWAEERRTGTIELLLTLPVTLGQAIVGKFLAAWAFIGIALALTVTIIPTTLFALGGDLDLGVAFAGYLGSFLLAGACVAVGTLTSAMTRSQVVGFVLALVVCLVFNLAGFDPLIRLFSGWWPALADVVAQCSFLRHFESMRRGVLDLADLAYYAGVMIVALTATHVVLNSRKAA